MTMIGRWSSHVVAERHLARDPTFGPRDLAYKKSGFTLVPDKKGRELARA
jgi:hypothetical protein